MRPTKQNVSTSVMQRRREPHNSLDDFPTPPWATRALCEMIGGEVGLSLLSCREPAANRGHMVRPLREYFGAVEASDIFDYGAGFRVEDYLFGPDQEPTDWTITNPPFRLAEQFIKRALRTSTKGVAVIVRSAFLESVGRWEGLFCPHPPNRVMQLTERAPMFKGRIGYEGEPSATAYSWIVWHTDTPTTQTVLEWIPPCRERLTRPGDHPQKPPKAKRSEQYELEPQTTED